MCASRTALSRSAITCCSPAPDRPRAAFPWAARPPFANGPLGEWSIRHAHPPPFGADHALDQCRCDDSNDRERLADLQRLATVPLRVPRVADAGPLAWWRARLALRSDVAAGREFRSLSRLWLAIGPHPPASVP